ncbi:MAG: type II CAAX endopeptidase family protein [Cyanobacteriota bacterium]|nr:type II CAAX endopeptidase family protein [Cyanobacteriota bacterium]
MTQSSPSDLEPLSRVQVLSVMAFTAVLLLAVAKIWQYWGQIRLLSLRFVPLDFLWSLGLALVIVLASGVIYRLWPAYRQSADRYLELVLTPLTWPDLLWLGLLPGLSEELLFRGVMLPALGLNLAAVLLTGLVFGVLHLSSPNQWPYVVWATVVGVALGYGALASGNLLVPVVAHICTNWISSALWKVQRRA